MSANISHVFAGYPTKAVRLATIVAASATAEVA